jgi:hypothetical protein
MLLLPPTQASLDDRAESQVSLHAEVSDSYAQSYAIGGRSASVNNAPDFRFRREDLTYLDSPMASGQVINIVAFVAELTPLRDVASAHGDFKVLTATVGDQSGGFLGVTAWRDQAEVLAKNLRASDVVYLSSAYTAGVHYIVT